MNLIFRLIWVVIGAFFRPKMAPMDESRITLRVLPTDLDTNIHMNNGRYMTIMDLGRVDLIIRTGLLDTLRREKWYPVVGTAKMRFKKSLSPFQKFDLTTRILGWDEKWVYLQQDFVVGDVVYASGIVKTLFLKGSNKISSAELAAVIDMNPESPALDPEMVQALQ